MSSSHTSNPPARLVALARGRAVLTYSALGVWFAVMAVVGASLLARHVIPLPTPDVETSVESAIATLRGPDDGERWLAVHVLYSECRCSRQIAEHLVEVGRDPDVAEHVLLVGEDAELARALRASGFVVEPIDADRLASEFHIASSPLFLVAAPDGSIRYSGGYTQRKQGPEPRDRAILAGLRDGDGADSLPVYGCAVSARLQRDLNPLALP